MSIYFVYYHRCGVLFRRYLIATDLGCNREVIPECATFPTFICDPLKLQIDQITYCQFVNGSQYLFYIIAPVNLHLSDIVFMTKINVLIVLNTFTPYV